jgi:hypothetical protein
MNESKIDWAEVGITFGACLAAVVAGGFILWSILGPDDKKEKDEKKVASK